MSDFAVIKGAAYTLAATPDMVLTAGTTQTTEKLVNPDSDYLKDIPKYLRSYEEIVNYIPNQVYIGNITPNELDKIELPWFDKKAENAKPVGKHGEILTQPEFYGLMQICDVFDLVKLEKSFSESVKAKLNAHPLLSGEKADILDKNQDSEDDIKALVEEEHAEPLYDGGKLIGAVKKAHDVDVNLSSHVILENLVTKASSVLSLLNLVKVTGVAAEDVEYVIDCCEEACGDMNQRGGGNFAKAAAETAGFINATGCDVRGFCAAPSHAILTAASLVKAGTFKTVAVTGGGCTAKLGMNGKDHIKKEMPILEDVVAGFAVLITADDSVSPVVRTDIVGRHNVGTGSSPQAVISSLVTDPLDRANLKLTDIDKFSPEMQNPDITKPAGAGDVPEANYKMIAALGVKRGELERAQIGDFVKTHGMMGWAPTQGHIPSGVPYIGHCIDSIKAGDTKNAMIIGKGSLFLGRMTNLFDGVSFLIEKNEGSAASKEDSCTEATSDFNAQGINISTAGSNPVIGVANEGSEHGDDNIKQGIEMARKKGYSAVLIEGGDVHAKMEGMLKSGDIAGAVTMHYNFPIGVSTVGRIITPSKGKELYLANTTGTSDTDRVAAMVRNAIAGIISAKASGVKSPTVGIANIDGARQAEKALLELKKRGYDINFAESVRDDGGIVMRGNDLLSATSDIMVMDALTGNLMVKMFSAYTSGGNYESTGYGYGPGIGEGYDKLVMILSRASGAPVISGAIEYATSLVNGKWFDIAKAEYASANKAGLKEIIESIKNSNKAASKEEVAKPAPAKEPVTEQIPGIEVMDLEDAVEALWNEGIYAESGMGCTGPIVMISTANKDKAINILTEKSYI